MVSQNLSILSDKGSATCLCNLFHCMTTLTMQESFLLSSCSSWLQTFSQNSAVRDSRRSVLPTKMGEKGLKPFICHCLALQDLLVLSTADPHFSNLPFSYICRSSSCCLPCYGNSILYLHSQSGICIPPGPHGPDSISCMLPFQFQVLSRATSSIM